jgi:hypothetical protein
MKLLGSILKVLFLGMVQDPVDSVSDLVEDELRNGITEFTSTPLIVLLSFE